MAWDIARIPLLTAAEEVELAQDIEAGLYARHLLEAGQWNVEASAEELRELAEHGQKAFERFVRANVGLARSKAIALEPRVHGISLDDLTSEGMLGIIRAVQKFDYTRGLKFSTYATWWVRVFQSKAVLNAMPTKLDSAERDDYVRLAPARAVLQKELGRPATTAEVAAHLGWTTDYVTALELAGAAALSLERPLSNSDDRDLTLKDLLADRQIVDADNEAAEDVDRILGSLTVRERSLIIELFGLAPGTHPRTVEEIAAKRGVSPQFISRAAQAAMAQLRSAAHNQTPAAA